MSFKVSSSQKGFMILRLGAAVLGSADPALAGLASCHS